MTPPDVTAPGVSTDDAPPPPTAGRRAPAPTRIQRRTVATAVVASGFAVLAVVVIGIWLSRSGKRAATAPEVAAKADVSAAPKQQPSTGVTAQPQPSVAPVASASAAPEAEPDTDAAPTEPQTKETLFGQKNVESCETLLTGVAVDSLIGGAHHQYKVARRGIVSGNLKSAQRAYCAAEKLAPMDSKSWAGVAGILIMRGDGAKAAVHAKKAVDLNPDEPSHRYVLADALTLAERPAEAKAELVALAGASTKDKALADRFAGQGQLAARAGDCNRAERLFRRALAVTRQRADAAAGLARCYLTRRAFPVAIEWARRATQWDSRKSDYQVLLGDALAASGAKAEARSAWTKALELNPRDSNAKLRIDRGA